MQMRIFLDATYIGLYAEPLKGSSFFFIYTNNEVSHETEFKHLF